MEMVITVSLLVGCGTRGMLYDRRKALVIEDFQ